MEDFLFGKVQDIHHQSYDGMEKEASDVEIRSLKESQVNLHYPGEYCSQTNVSTNVSTSHYAWTSTNHKQHAPTCVFTNTNNTDSTSQSFFNHGTLHLAPRSYPIGTSTFTTATSSWSSSCFSCFLEFNFEIMLGDFCIFCSDSEKLPGSQMGKTPCFGWREFRPCFDSGLPGLGLQKRDVIFQGSR